MFGDLFLGYHLEHIYWVESSVNKQISLNFVLFLVRGRAFFWRRDAQGDRLASPSTVKLLINWQFLLCLRKSEALDGKSYLWRKGIRCKFGVSFLICFKSARNSKMIAWISHRLSFYHPPMKLRKVFSFVCVSVVLFTSRVSMWPLTVIPPHSWSSSPYGDPSPVLTLPPDIFKLVHMAIIIQRPSFSPGPPESDQLALD